MTLQKTTTCAPVHPEYAELPPIERDVEAARALMEEAGMMDFEHELISIDDDWRKNTTDAVAAQLRDAGFNVKRTILPGSTFWNDWAKYPVFVDQLEPPPAWRAGACRLPIARARRGTNLAGPIPSLTRLLTEALAIADADKRREVMAKMQTADPRRRRDDASPTGGRSYRHGKEGLVGADMHITFEIHPVQARLRSLIP